MKNKEKAGASFKQWSRMKENNGNSILPTVLTLADNSWRLKKFQTRTVIIEEDGKKVVHKIATTKESNAFLKEIVKREQTNAKYLKEHFDVLRGHLKGNYIEYEYMPYQSLNQKIATELRENCYEKADELLGFYVRKVKALNQLHVCPKEFLSTVTQNTFENYKFEVDCFSRGLLDLTPRNILVDGNRWIVVDNEWSFDFPVPVIFVLFRAILEMVIQLQQEIRRCTKKTHPAVGIFARGLRTYYFPKEWVKYVAEPHISFAQMLRWEMGFRHYISGSSRGTVGRLKMNPKTKTHFSTRSLRSNITIIRIVSHFLKKLPGMRQLVYFCERTLLYLQK